jgi:hypothetical protein
MAKPNEQFRGVRDAFIGGFFVWFIDKVLLIDKWTEHQAVLLRVFFVALGALAVYLGGRYYLILGGGGDQKDSERREEYNSLRQQLSEGGTPANVYNRWLALILDKVDIFFGDSGRNDKSLIARILHLETNGPRWTAPAFDRCLLLAVIYPVITIFAVWSFSGHAGLAEQALFLQKDDPFDYYAGLHRLLTAAQMLLAAYATYRALPVTSYKSLLWFILAGSICIAYQVSAVMLAALATVISVGMVSALNVRVQAGIFAITLAISLPIANLLFHVNVPAAVPNAVGYVSSVAVVAIIIAAVVFASNWAARKGRLGLFQFLFFVAACTFCLIAPYVIAPMERWPLSGNLLLFYGLLTLVNAPIDWLATGFTRALLRRGLSRGGWWPFFYALIDVLVATVLIAVLAFIMVIAIQTFDDIAVLRAGSEARVLPLGPLFRGLQTAPSEYEYWWVWLLLFSSMVPSIINLSIAAAAFLRGLPRLNAWILDRMPIGSAVQQHDRIGVAGALTAQLVGGIALTGICTYLVATYLIPIGLPAFGGLVRDFAADLAFYDAPARTIMWLIGAK